MDQVDLDDELSWRVLFNLDFVLSRRGAFRRCLPDLFPDVGGPCWWCNENQNVGHGPLQCSFMLIDSHGATKVFLEKMFRTFHLIFGRSCAFCVDMQLEDEG